MSSLIADLGAQPIRWEVFGTVEAPAEEVAGLLLAVQPGRIGDDNALVLAGIKAARHGVMSIHPGRVPGTFHAAFNGADEQIDIVVDRAARAIAVQSWFGGIHTVEPAEDGVASRIVHRVHNVLPRQSFFAGIARIGMETRMARDLDRVLRVIADRLGCEAAGAMLSSAG